AEGPSGAVSAEPEACTATRPQSVRRSVQPPPSDSIRGRAPSAARVRVAVLAWAVNHNGATDSGALTGAGCEATTGASEQVGCGVSGSTVKVMPSGERTTTARPWGASSTAMLTPGGVALAAAAAQASRSLVSNPSVVSPTG